MTPELELLGLFLLSLLESLPLATSFEHLIRRDNNRKGCVTMEEEDTCRICRSGPEEDMPLYHPCKCSGSIAKVHQDCLIDWLQHSKKKVRAIQSRC